MSKSPAIEKRFLTAKSERTFERVLEVATELFKTKGFNETTMRDIARKSNLGLGALYYYCQSKEELVLLFYEQISARIFEEFMEQPNDARTLGEAFSDFIRLKLSYLAPYRKLLTVVLKESVDPDSSISPLSSQTSSIRQTSIDFFEELSQKFAKSKSTDTGKMLWLVHMVIIAFWLYDRSEEYASTEKLIDVVSQSIAWSGKINSLPGVNLLASQLVSSVLAFLK